MNKNLLSVIIFVSITFFIILYFSIFQPSYNSYRYICLDDKENLELGGSVSYNKTNNETQINVNIYNIEDKVIRHELCHVNQVINYRTYSCNKPLLYYLNEVECYTTQNIPNAIYKKIYITCQLKDLIKDVNITDIFNC